MASYNVPPDFSEKEKIVGGILTAMQLIWLLAGVMGAAIVSLALFPLIGNVAIVIGVLIFIPLGGLFALLKIKGLPLFEYLKLKKNHTYITKQLPNYRQEVDSYTISYESIEKVVKK